MTSEAGTTRAIEDDRPTAPATRAGSAPRLTGESATGLPLHLSLVDREVVVVGGGTVAARKVAALLDAGARVKVVTPWACPDLRTAAQGGRIRLLARNYRTGDLTGAWLAFAATDEPTVNQIVQAEADTRHIFCVRDDSMAEGSARSAAVLRRAEVVIAVSSTGVVDPRRVRHIRDTLAAALDAGMLEAGTPEPGTTGSGQLPEQSRVEEPSHA